MITTSEMDATGEEAISVRDVAQGKNGSGGDAIREGAGQEDAPGGTQTR